MYGVTLLLLSAGVYYIYNPKNSEFVEQATAQGDANSYGVTAMQVFSGKYLCLPDDGCATRTMLRMYDDATFEFTEFLDNGDIPVLGTGNWGVGKGGALIFMVTPVKQSSTVARFSIIAKKVSTLSISNFSKPEFFPNIIKPIFVRVGE